MKTGPAFGCARCLWVEVDLEYSPVAKTAATLPTKQSCQPRKDLFNNMLGSKGEL